MSAVKLDDVSKCYDDIIVYAISGIVSITIIHFAYKIVLESADEVLGKIQRKNSDNSLGSRK